MSCIGVDVELYIYFVCLFPAGPPFPFRLDHCASPKGLIQVSPLSWNAVHNLFLLSMPAIILRGWV